MIGIDLEKIGRVFQERGGITAWLMSRLHSGATKRERSKRRLALLDRISLTPRQSLTLVEAEGRRFLVGTSADGGPVFYALDGAAQSATRPAKTRALKSTGRCADGASARVSW